MTKKMAVRKNKPKQKRFEFKAPRLSKAIARATAVLTVLLGLGFAVYQGTQAYHDIWPVKQVMVENDLRYVKESDLAKFVMSQDVKGMLAIDIKQLQSKAVEIDWVKGVEVRKVWPDQLLFSVSELQPVAVVDGGILTREGTKIAKDDREWLFSSLPNLSIASTDKVTNQDYLKVWQEFKQIKRQLELLALNLDALKVDEVKNWHLSFDNGLQMNLGRKDRAERIARLVKVYASIKEVKRIKNIDLRYHNGISVEWLAADEALNS
ncbi:FtsQ-type POTRA domain-containing protein [Aliikangiella marina]|uniref:FtsQ-type POTRA domain-containing protein n=1 Tax=Aliikangiella marina TaxID=1712262 RepID=A0A545TDI7_9GAMM|nr:cell division protein FtsQ/DivIB [Aliikangiella marina]TQV75284.1 FtsQ-type POTRA domain-containing protein [Aliikangiella marina]